MSRPPTSWWLALTALTACSFVPSGLRPGDGDAADPDAVALDGGLDDAGDPDASDPDASSPDPDASGPDAAAIDATAIDASAIDATDVDAPPTTGRTLIDDTAADFGQGGPLFTEARLEASGAVAPRAYYMGSLCAGGSDTRLFGDGTTADGSVLPATPAKLALARTVDLNLASGGFPVGVGITNGNDWTLWWYGELFLTAGTHGFALTGDDHAFLELAPIGTTTFTKLIGVNTGSASATFSAPHTGWYGFRVALAQRGGGVDLYPQLDGATIPRHLTRCRVDGVSGLALTGFDEAQFLDVGATTVIGDTTAANVDWGNGAPGDLGISDPNTFSVRWVGQFFIDVAGNYTLRIQTDDGYRFWVDGASQFINLADGTYDRTTGALNLARGWHDLVFDTTESFLGAKSILTVASGPELAGGPFPPARLRPAEARSERFESLTAGSVAEPGPAMFGFAPPAAATITGVDVGYHLLVDNTVSNVTTNVRNAATTTTLRNNTLTGDTTDRFHPTVFDGTAVTGAWGIGFDIASGGGSLSQSWLTVRYADAAGTGPTPTLATFESSVRDLLAPGGTTVAALGPATLTVRTAPGAVVSIAFRTCATAGACAAAPWSGEFGSGDPLTGVVPRRFVQYRLRLATDGDHEPAVERVQLDYQTQ